VAFLYNSTWGLKIAQPNQTLVGYHKHPQRAAWMIITLAQLTLCLLVLSIFWGAKWYITNAKDHFPINITSINGTVLAKPIGTEASIAILRGNQLEVAEFTIVTTDSTSQAVLSFFDDSTITLYSNTTLIIYHSNRPRFNLSPEHDTLEVEIIRGRIRAAPSDQAGNRDFVIKTPQAEARLTPGSYAVEVNNDQTQVTTRLGQAAVIAKATSVTLLEGELSTIGQGKAPTEPSTAEQNLLVNGDFSAELEDTWTQDFFIPENQTDVISARIQAEQVDGRPVLVFSSQGQDNIHTDAAIEQVIDKDVRDFQSLRINADVMLNYQSLPGGGFVGSEFPIRIKLTYKDASGNDREWYHGFYYEPPPDNYILYNQVDNASDNISQNIWYPYESENLLGLLGENKPVYVKSIRIYASGWIYHAMVADVKLLAQD
jgi:hypothetical protein